MQCRSTEFLPLEYVTVKGVEEKVFSEQQQQLKGYTRKQAQDCYIHASCSLPTYGSVFFPCKVGLFPQVWLVRVRKVLKFSRGLCK